MLSNFFVHSRQLVPDRVVPDPGAPVVRIVHLVRHPAGIDVADGAGRVVALEVALLRASDLPFDVGGVLRERDRDRPGDSDERVVSHGYRLRRRAEARCVLHRRRIRPDQAAVLLDDRLVLLEVVLRAARETEDVDLELRLARHLAAPKLERLHLHRHEAIERFVLLRCGPAGHRERLVDLLVQLAVVPSLVRPRLVRDRRRPRGRRGRQERDGCHASDARENPAAARHCAGV